MAGIGQCPICLSHLTASQTYAVVKCGHTFHEKCIRQWIKTGKNCSSCRTKATERDIVKLYIQETSLDDTFATQDPHSAQRVAELQSKYDDVNEELAKVLGEKQKLAAEKRSLTKHIEKLNKEKEQIFILQAQLRSMEDQLQSYNAMRNELESTKAKLRASLFYKMLTEKGKGESEFDDYVTSNGIINETKFLKMMTNKNNDLTRRLEISNKSLKETEKSLTSEKQKRLRDQELITKLQEEVKKYREAVANGEEPPTPNPALKEIISYSPPGKKSRLSLGFNRDTPVYSKHIMDSAHKQKPNFRTYDLSYTSPKIKKPLKAFRNVYEEIDMDNQPTTSHSAAINEVSPMVPRFTRHSSSTKSIGSKFGTSINDKHAAILKSTTKKKNTVAPKKAAKSLGTQEIANISLITLDDTIE